MEEAGMPAAAHANAPVQIKRDLRIDFLRGLALIFIFADHVPESLFSLVTVHSFAFADAAEMFFFLSGFVAAMVYGRIAVAKGFAAATGKVWRRAVVLYVAQLILLALVVAGVGLAAAGTGHFQYFAQLRLDAVLTRPGPALVHALALRYQPVYLDILPVYVVLMAIFPLALLGMARNMWLVLVPSAALYAGVQIWALAPHTFPGGEVWFFNPLAWQFLFLCGAALGHPQTEIRWRGFDNPWLLRAAIAVAAIVAVVQFPDALRTVWPQLPGLKPADLPVDKGPLEPLRLVSFVAMAVIARRYLPAGERLAASAAGRQVIRCGQYSLQIFCAGVLLAIAGRIVGEESGYTFGIQTLVTVVGIVLLFGFAAYLERLRRDGSWLAALRLRRPQAA